MNKFFSEICLRLPELDFLKPNFEKALTCLENLYKNGGKILVCGNGGSAADCEHIVAELMKGFLLPRKLPQHLFNMLKNGGCPENLCCSLQTGIPAVSLAAGVALSTAFANDVCCEYVFAQQVLNLGKKGDCLISLSTSGNSKNVIAAMQVARAMQITNIGFTGNRDCQLRKLADILIDVPSAVTPQIQEYHLAIYHALCADIENRLFG